jgi:hyperosmotically inducible periplasmic protein
MNRKRASVLITAASCMLAAGAVFADATGTKSDQPVTDSYITTKVKAELAKDHDTKATKIHVKTKDGVVALTGVVNSSAEKTKAEEDARTVKGVVDVKNGLQIKEASADTDHAAAR